MKGLLKKAVAVSILALCAGGAHAQKRPDLQGFWSNQSVTRMERPQGVDKLNVSEAEAIELERSSLWNQVYREQAGAVNVNEPLAAGAAAFETRGYNAFWIDPGRRLSKVKGDYRTSWVVEPSNGRIPWKTGGALWFRPPRASRRSEAITGSRPARLPSDACSASPTPADR